MAGSEQEYAMIVPQGLTEQELQSKLDFWVENGRNATGENRTWTDGMIQYLRRRVHMFRIYRAIRRIQPTAHFRFRNLDMYGDL
jgi:hypothetical protein